MNIMAFVMACVITWMASMSLILIGNIIASRKRRRDVVEDKWFEDDD